MGIKGTKTWDDVQTWLAANASVSAGSYNASGAWTLGAAGGVQVQQLNGAFQFSTGSSTPVPTYGLRRNGSNALEFFTNGISSGYSDSSNIWTFGPTAATSGTHYFNGRLTVESQGAINQQLTLRSGSSATDCTLELFNNYANPAGRNYIIADISANPAADAGTDPVLAMIIRRDGGSNITTRPLWALRNNNTSVGIVEASGAWTFGTNSASNLTHTFWGGSNNTTPVPPTAGALGDYVITLRSAATSSTRAGMILFRDGTDVTQGFITIDAVSNTTSYTTSSDERLKTYPQEFDGMSLIGKMLPKQYERISNLGTKEYGFYAQELYTAYPQAVLVGGEDPNKNPWSIDYGKLTPVLVKAIQELKQQLDEAKARIEQLENP